MKKLIAVCGSDEDDITLVDYALKTAERVGELIAERGAVLVCGGKGGIMEAACRGAKRKNGITVGILPESKDEANVFVDIPIETRLGNLRNYLVVRSADAVIAIGGRWGTLNEISFAMILEKPLVLIKNTGGCVEKIIENKIMENIESTYYVTNNAEEAVEKAFELII